jgi:hypothetical protein
VSDAVTSGTDLESATAHFTSADVGQSVVGSSGYSATQGGLTVIPSGTTIVAVNSATDATLSQSASQNTSGVDVTIGSLETAPASVTGDFDYQASGCTSTITGTGVYAPTMATLTGQNAGNQDTVISLYQNPSNLTLNLSYPTIGSGWADNGGGGSTAQPTTTETFTSSTKDKVGEQCGQLLCLYTDTYSGGAATGDFPTAAASLSLYSLSDVQCTAGELQAITSGSGPDAGTIPRGGSELEYCDGGTKNPSEQVDSSSPFGSDGTPWVAFWSLVDEEDASTVF